MYSSIAIPADVSVQALARALATIGLKPTAGKSRILTFDHAQRGAVPCGEPGCTRPALVTDAAVNRCAKHWMQTKVQPA